MRIIGGVLGGRTLRAPRGAATRPTSDKVRGALFSILGAPPEGARVLDLFAGAGALGLEALSRGAADCVFVERADPAADAIEANIKALGLGDRATILRHSVAAGLARVGQRGAFTWIFVDPPYAGTEAVSTLAALAKSKLLAANGVVVVEHDKRNPPADAYDKLALHDRRRYGDTEISFYRERTT